MLSKHIDPLGITISISDNDAQTGDHPFKHSLPRDAISETIEKPIYIYGHTLFPEVAHYVRFYCDGPPDPQPGNKKHTMCIAVVEYDTCDTGKVVTSMYTNYLSEKSINVKDEKYNVNKKRR